MLATSGSDRTAIIWELDFETNSANLLTTLTAHNAAVHSVHFAPDGQSLITVTRREIRLWDISSLYGDAEGNDPTELLAFPGGQDIAFNSERHELIIAGNDSIVRTYMLDIQELLALARSRLTRTFTAEECRQYRIDPCPTEP